MNMPITFAPAADGHKRLLLDTTRLSTPVEQRLAVLVVDDEDAVREELAEALDRKGLPVLTANSAEAALGVLKGRPDIGALVSDIRMPGMDGLELAEAVLAGRAETEALEVVLVTGYITPGHTLAASRLGAYGVLLKPTRAADISRLAAEALDRAAQRRLKARLPARPDPLADPLAPPAATRSPTQAAEALLHTLTQRLTESGAALEATARDLRAPLAALLEAGPRDTAAKRETHRLLGLIDELLEVAALEAGSLQPSLAPVSAHGLLSAVATRLGAHGIRTARRITLQPDADPAFLLDTTRLVRAIGLLADRALRGAGGEAKAELSVDAGAGQARIDLTIRTGVPIVDEPAPEQLLPVSIARRMLAQQGGRLDAWTLPEGGLRARLLIRGA